MLNGFRLGFPKGASKGHPSFWEKHVQKILMCVYEFANFGVVMTTPPLGSVFWGNVFPPGTVKRAGNGPGQVSARGPFGPGRADFFLGGPG